MRTTPQERIDELTQQGWWGTETLDSLFVDAVEKYGSRTAVIDQFDRSNFTDGDAQRLSFDEVGNAANNLAAVFFENGLRRDDIVVIQLPNIVELAILYLALGKLGVIISPIPIQYGPFEISKARDLVKPKAFISLANFKGKNYAREHGAAFTQDSKVFCFGSDTPSDATGLALDVDKTTANADYLAYINDLDLDANDIFTVCWTSGTTGQPKGVPRSHNMWIASATASMDSADLGENETVLNPFPMVNMAAIGGFLYPWLIRGCTLVLHHPFDMQVFLKQVQDEKVAYTIAPPAVLTMLLNQRQILDSYDLSNLRRIGSGSAPLSEFLIAGFGQDYNIDILNIFGSNEGICLTSGPNDLPDYADRAHFFPRFGIEGLNWDGRAREFIKTRLIDTKSGELVTELGIEGELEIWGATVFDGYYDSPEANAEVFSSDGYFRTGDVFELTGDGEIPQFYRYIGRCKDIIVRGGVNISPSEIDSELTAHPKVADVCVVGVDDDILGERVAVAVVAKPGETILLKDLTNFLKEKGMAVFKLPEKLLCVESLPYNATGKIQRRDVKGLFDNH
jgi:acyl-CoA synthetase (AMP-forming)/AMP-acid ligase II